MSGRCKYQTSQQDTGLFKRSFWHCLSVTFFPFHKSYLIDTAGDAPHPDIIQWSSSRQACADRLSLRDPTPLWLRGPQGGVEIRYFNFSISTKDKLKYFNKSWHSPVVNFNRFCILVQLIHLSRREVERLKFYYRGMSGIDKALSNLCLCRPR